MLQEIINNTNEFIGENLFSILTLIIASIALLQTHKQVKISNKQNLFNKRVDNFLIIDGLIKLYEENKKLIEIKENNVFLEVTTLFMGLTNNTYLKDIGTIIKEVENEEIRQKFLIKLEEMKKLSLEHQLLFNGNNIKYIEEFVMEYQNLLRALYKYQALLDKILKANKKEPKSFEEWQKLYREDVERKEVFDSYDKIQNLYNDIKNKNVIRDVKSQIKL